MIVTLDTNVLFQALYSRRSAAFEILGLLRTEKLRLALSVPTYLEYQDVLLRSESLQSFGLDSAEVESVLLAIALLADKFDINFLWRPNLRDEADNMFVELAVRSQSSFIITHNYRDFTVNRELLFDSFRLITPAQFMCYWREMYE